MDKVIYLAAGYAKLQYENVTYNDLIVPRENRQNMLDVNLTPYDILLATPPCNFYSYARGSNPPSKYALETAHLLLEIIIKFYKTGKPFIVENVSNKNSLDFIWALSTELGLYRFKYSRHTYITNCYFDVRSAQKYFDFIKERNPYFDKQGGFQVSEVLDLFIKSVLQAPLAAQPAQPAQPAQSEQVHKAQQAWGSDKAPLAAQPSLRQTPYSDKIDIFISHARIELEKRLKLKM